MSSPKEMWHAARHPPTDPKHLSFKGKTILVTGANSGLGHAAAIKYAAQGASKLILGVRTQEKGEDAKAAIIRATGCSPEIFIIQTLDLANFESLQEFATRVDASVPDLHILQLAGGVASMEFATSPQGYVVDLQLGAYAFSLIALLLLPKVRATAQRLVASGSDDYCYISFLNSVGSLEVVNDDIPQGQTLIQRIHDQSKFDARKQYFLLKLAAWYAIRGVAERADGGGDVTKTRVIVTATCPGMCKTNMVRNESFLQQMIMSMTWAVLGRSAEEGARTLVGSTGLGPEVHKRMWTNDKIAPLSALMQSERDKELFQQTWDETLAVLRKYVKSDLI